jgi:crotonobetainyl-CoA:carnitine CoA-transferase CaiB-like acyl-CoA transferase
MQQPQLLEDSRFKTVSLRIANLNALMQLIKDWAATIETIHELEQRLAEQKLAMGQLRSVAEVAKTDWAKQRNAFVEVDDRGESTVKLPNSPWRFSGSDTSTRGTVKYRGEDNAEVFSELLGLSPSEIKELHQREILVQRLANNK